MIRHIILLFLILLTNFAFSQVRTVTLTQTHTDAIKGIDRKAWSGLNNTGPLSAGYANDFTLPAKINPCEKITNVKVEIKITKYSNTSGCGVNPTYFNLFYGCSTYAGGATCLPANVIAEPNYPPNTPGATLNFINNNNKFNFGGILSVDIIPVSIPCRPVLSGGLTYEYTTTVTVTIAEDLSTTPAFTQVAPICSGGSLSSLPTTSNNGISGTWAPALNNLATTTYTYTPNSDECATSTTMTIVVNSVTLVITNPAPVCSGGTVDITSSAVTTGSTTGTTLTYWTDAAATIGLPNPSSITTSGTYYIKSTLGSCETIKPVVVTIAPPIVLPVVTTLINLCVSAPTALIATPSVGHTLKWYGTAATGGTASSIATIPIATGTYYVSQTDGVCESSRVPIQVNLVADTGATFQNFRCDSSQILPSDKNSSVYFDWSNNPLTPNDVYSYSYTIQGGSAVTSTTINSSLQVFGMLPGQSATLTLYSAKYPCKPTVTETCIVPCGTSTVTPTFAAIPTSYCLNDIPPILPTTSTNTSPITGSWSPFPVDTSTMGTKIYTFIPDPILFPCALKTTSLSISIGPIEPDFTGFSICSGDPTSSLSNVSTNGITGIWSPTDIVDSSVLGIGTFPFTFIPDLGQPCTPSNKTINVTVNPSNVILSLNWTVTEAFSKNQIVTVTDPLGSNYLYQMDFGPFQTSPVFENVASGLHSISVKHVNGCSEFTDNNVLIIGYPKFFTPNGDGYNDTWNIPGLKDQLNSRIHIFDRYGKLLKDISPNDPGWDGTYIGQLMPADDYWFNVEYIENAILKKFKSHFSLKR